MITPLSAVGVTRYHRPQKNFTALRNSFVRDARVTLRAFRVGAYVLSHAEGFTQTQAQIAAGCNLAVNTVRAALVDLERDRYLARRVIREHGRIVGTAYAISDTPFTDAELAQLTSDDVPSEPCAESAHTESAPPKKTRSRRDSSSVEEEQPSGGTAAAVAPDDQEETPEMPRGKTADQPGLFEVTMEVAPRQGGKMTAQEIVAAFVDSHRSHHGSDPTRSEIGRVARDVKALLGTTVTTDQLTSAAKALGRTPFANISMQLKIGSRSAGKGIARAHPHGEVEWAEGSQVVNSEAAAVLEAAPDLAAWFAGQAASA